MARALRMTWLVVLVPILAAGATAQSSGWKKRMNLLRPLTQAELDKLKEKLDQAAAAGVTFTWGRPDLPAPPPVRVRLLTMSRRDWHRAMTDFDGETLPGSDVPEDGVPEIALSPETLDDDTPPGKVASTVTHEMGHTQNPGAKDENDDGSTDVPGQVAHFALYKDDLKQLCVYINWLKNEPGNKWYRYLCDLCKHYDSSRRHANGLKRPLNEPAIGKCAGCVDC